MDNKPHLCNHCSLPVSIDTAIVKQREDFEMLKSGDSKEVLDTKAVVNSNDYLHFCNDECLLVYTSAVHQVGANLLFIMFTCSSCSIAILCTVHTVHTVALVIGKVNTADMKEVFRNCN